MSPPELPDEPPPNAPGYPQGGHAGYFDHGHEGYFDHGHAGYFDHGHEGYFDHGHEGYFDHGHAGYFDHGHAGYFDHGHGGYFDHGHGGYFDHGHGGYFDHGHGGYFDHGHDGYFDHDPGHSRPVYDQSREGAVLGSGIRRSSSYAWVPVHDRTPASAAVPDRPLRAIYLGPCLARGGAEVWLADLVRFLNPNRVKFVAAVVTDPGKVDPEYAREFPLPVEAGDDAVLRGLEGCDVVVSWGLRLGPLPVANGRRPPLSVFVAHGDGSFTRDLVASNAGHVDHVLAVSGRVRDVACEGVPATVVHNGVDTARLASTLPRDAVRRGLGFGPDDFVLGFLGRLAPEKRADLVLKAVASLPPRFKALVVGWGPMLPYLVDMAERLLPGRFAFVTAAEYLGDYYRAMDAFCTPGDTEGTPLTLLEAMFCDVPSMSTFVGAVPELLVDRVNGLVVPQHAGAIAGAAAALADHPHWARGLAAQGRATVERVGHASRMARDIEGLLARLWAEKFGAAAAV